MKSPPPPQQKSSFLYDSSLSNYTHAPSSSGFHQQPPQAPSQQSQQPQSLFDSKRPTFGYSESNNPSSTSYIYPTTSLQNSDQQQHLPPPSQQQQQQPYQPFDYVSTVASTVPIHDEDDTRRNTNNKPRRKKTGSKRSVDELLNDSSISTNMSLSSNSTYPGERQTKMPLLAENPSTNTTTNSTFGFNSAAMVPAGLPLGQGSLPPNITNAQPPFNPAAAAAAAGPQGYLPSSFFPPPTSPLSIPEPPLATATPINPSALQSDPQPRPKKKSKYSTEQDNIIIKMKREGKTWIEISEAAQCGNALAARNRYQVLIGQQGGGAVVWETEDTLSLKNLLEEGEKAKWKYIAEELSRRRNKKLTSSDCQKKTKEIFDENPAFFGIMINQNPSDPNGSLNFAAYLGPSNWGFSSSNSQITNSVYPMLQQTTSDTSGTPPNGMQPPPLPGGPSSHHQVMISPPSAQMSGPYLGMPSQATSTNPHESGTNKSSNQMELILPAMNSTSNGTSADGNASGNSNANNDTNDSTVSVRLVPIPESGTSSHYSYNNGQSQYLG